MKPFYYQRRKAQFDTYSWLICEVIGLLEEDAFWWLVDCGIWYVRDHCDRPELRQELVNSRDFWCWWVNQWNLRNETFVEQHQLYRFAGEELAYATRLALFNKYYDLHHPEVYCSITEASFERVATKIICRHNEVLA